ncbi:MAG TPA: hypothetical protein VEA60_02615 [Allosphingosinicella sp.]|nr:hypothetical protein [Allosphingosinicella sp.]
MHRLLAAAAIALMSVAPAAARQSDREEANLLGAVRSVQSRISEDAGAEREGGRTRQLGLVAYDPSGNEVERTVHDDYGFLVGRERRTRDPDGNLIESVLTDPKGEILERQVYAYGGGRLAQIVHHDGSGKAGLRETHSYDSAGRLSDVTYYEGEEAVGRTAYRHDGRGRVLEVAFFLADGSRAVAPVGPCLGAHRMTTAYDELDRPVEVVAYEPDGEKKKAWLYAYDSKGQLAEDRREDSSSIIVFAYSYEYDSRGNWTRQIATATRQAKRSPRLAALEHSLEVTGEPYQSRTIISRQIAYD